MDYDFMKGTSGKRAGFERKSLYKSQWDEMRGERKPTKNLLKKVL